MTESFSDPYAVLGVPRDATRARIADAYRALVRQRHPDLLGQGQVTAASSAELLAVLEAFRVLGDPARRGEYDRRHPASPAHPVTVRNHSEDVFVIPFGFFGSPTAFPRPVREFFL
jgi:curved DNA-binding protein CbpA